MRLKLLSLLLIVCSCSSNNITQKIVAIDLEKPNNKELVDDFLNSISDVEIVPLETNANSIFSTATSYRPAVYGDDIFFFDFIKSEIFRFNKKGEFVGKISRAGRGPEEYLLGRGISVYNNMLYVLTQTDLKKYDLEGNYKGTFDISAGYQIKVLDNGDIAVTNANDKDYGLVIYDSQGVKKGEYFGFPENYKEARLARSPLASLSFNDGNLYLTNYFSNSILQYNNNGVDTLIKFDFGNYNIEPKIKDVTPYDLLEAFTEHRESSVMSIDFLSVSEDWIIFYPELYGNTMTVYFNRKSGDYFTNKEFIEPYSSFLGKHFTPFYYDSSTKTYYSLLRNLDLIEMLETIDESAKSKYPFLKDLNYKEIDDEANDWIVYWRIN